MKIVFTGGGTGGHFYPIIAVVQKVNQLIDQNNIIGAKLYYFSDSPYDKAMLSENSLSFEEIHSGKMRLYFSFKNFIDIFKVCFGIVNALIKLYSVYPDVIFSKGGYAAFPTLVAGRILGIPIIMHESDSAPGRVNKWTGKFATKIAVSFKEAGEFFPKDKVAWTGHPIRNEISEKIDRDKALDYFKLESNLPVILILGGSQGAELINQTVVDALPDLIKKYQVIHQTGVNNFKSITGRAEVVLGDDINKTRYTPLAFLNNLSMKMAAGSADIIISRAGSMIFEIASWGVPSIIIPITNSNDDHQRKNAYNYAHTGSCIVIEEVNMTSHILYSEIQRILDSKNIKEKMQKATEAFNKKDAALQIAQEIIKISFSHEK
ncbi:MAG: UDP-N-acetylglucosamine--N-acetylmuramyl-(pentapeptide) pyrophosphoryl-undecaprenol N-acetylglucosamine transferase [bacterium]|nr:UDP-N-acetylglucosamine--N-acetylmuramyl-(pentapeptide) pyrophosphoryl-undecaprenol N-acetylglucosamine transferase [bacterium]